MAEKKFTTKKMNLREHDARLKSLPTQGSVPLGWIVAFAALALGLILLYLQR